MNTYKMSGTHTQEILQVLKERGKNRTLWTVGIPLHFQVFHEVRFRVFSVPEQKSPAPANH